MTLWFDMVWDDSDEPDFFADNEDQPEDFSEGDWLFSTELERDSVKRWEVAREEPHFDRDQPLEGGTEDK